MRDAAYVRQCGKVDAEAKHRRKVTSWFAKGNGVCALCRCSLGKKYERCERKQHEQQYRHQELYREYCTAFEQMTAEIYERILREQAVRKDEERARLQSGMLGPLLSIAPGHAPSQWLTGPVDSSVLKAALFDHACRAGLDPCGTFATPECREAVERHVRCAQRALLLKAAQVSLAAGGDDSRAVTAWSLCAGYV